MLVGVRLIVGATPKPESLTMMGLSVEPVPMVIAPNCTSLAVGVNRMLIWQVEPAVIVAGQSLELVNAPPVVVMPPGLRSPLPAFETVRIIAVLVVPTPCIPKSKTLVDNVREPTPFPESVTTSLVELLVILS
jgi:hypothetical protein